eukprot:TRINITY_DN3541_c0_g1_i2.p1 TRINITY_DN3541_c0_g1~~TRINITY_DN3541_c0_g1_i2.p1  ORF type:complete len:577 (-),score=176.64 TRINITY_DN3541_c0_g1_i2:373-2103(-)
MIFVVLMCELYYCSNGCFFFFFKQKTAYEMLRSLVGSEMCIRDSFLTATEHQRDRGGFKPAKNNRAFKKLPFSCCAISLAPFEDPVCDPQGNVFDIVNLVPFMQKYKRNPVTGEKMGSKDITKLTFHKDNEGNYCCPSTYKLFNEHTHIVTIKTTGNVYSMDAIQELCIKPKNWRDLVDDSPFVRSDLIDLQDPHKVGVESSSFWCHKNTLTDKPSDEKAVGADALNATANTGQLSRVLQQVKPKSSFEGSAAPGINKVGIAAADKALAMVRDKAEREKQAELERLKKKGMLPPPEAKKPRPVHSYSTGVAAASFTSTSCDVVTENVSLEFSDADMRDRIYRRVKKKGTKGYARMKTTHGDLNIELHCDLAPLACDNWLQLAEADYYNETVFHRMIPDFMIQGGDPTGKGTGGMSVWGKPFKDEFHPKLSHTHRGILSMANKGSNTNKSQFFMTFKSAIHLDNLHTVFGRVVGGLATLNNMEQVETDSSKRGEDRPVVDIKIISIQVFVNPFADHEKAQEEEDEAARKKAEEEKVYKEELGSWFSNPAPQGSTGGVGKYMPQVGGGAEPAPKRLKQ